MHDHLTIPKR